MIASKINICMEVSMDFIPRKAFHGLVNWFIWLEWVLQFGNMQMLLNVRKLSSLSPFPLSVAPGRAYYLLIGFWFVSELYIKMRVHKIFSFRHCVLRVWKLSYTLCTLTSWLSFCCWVAHSCPTLCLPMDRSTPGCASPSFAAYSNSCPLSQWYHPTISSAIVPFSACLRSASGSFLISRLFTLGDESIGVSASASVLPVNTQDWSPLGWTGWISLQWDSQESSPIPQLKSISSSGSAFFIAQLTHPYVTTGKTIALAIWAFVGKVMSLLFNMLFGFVIAFLPRSKCLFISWLQSPSVVNLEPKKIVSHCFHYFPIYLQWNDGTRCHDLSFLKVEF